MEIKTYKSIIEALLFVAGEALPLKEIAGVLEIDENTAKKIINQMIDEYREEKRGLQVIEINDSYQFSTSPQYYEYIEKLVKPKGKQGLSTAALETLSIIAYKQPITKGEIDSIRGVHSESSIARLNEKELIKEIARLDVPGRPILYGTTDHFLRLFGLRNISELPSIEEKHVME